MALPEPPLFPLVLSLSKDFREGAGQPFRAAFRGQSLELHLETPGPLMDPVREVNAE